MINRQDIEKIITRRPAFSDLVFQRGFLITTSDADLTKISFCRKWVKQQLGSFFIWTHPNTNLFHTTDTNGKLFFLLGHAYDPVKMVFKEEDILQELSSSFESDHDAYQDVIDGLTGIFLTGVIDGSKIRFQSDAVSMYASFSGIIDGQFYLGSHSNLVECLTGVARDPYVDELVTYKYYPYFGASLPGVMSAYRGLERTQCNSEYFYDGQAISSARIYPRRKPEARPYRDLIQEICTLLENNMTLIWSKWGEKAALSLTGGRDSTTSLAGAHNLLSSLRTFSYVSCEGEQYDASAAELIAKEVQVSHETYQIELSEEEQAECEDMGSIIDYNMGSIGGVKEKDIRKRVFFFHHPKFEVEIKSWVDEIGRARLHKRYLKKQFPERLKPRYLTTVYKPFGLNRKLVRKTDEAFSAYIDRYYPKEVLDLVPWWDLIYWEYLWASNEALHLVGEHMLTALVTIPFNNRILLDTMLCVDLEKRIDDSIQKDIIECLLPAINQTGVHVKDFGWDRKRELAERLYWEVQTKLPF